MSWVDVWIWPKVDTRRTAQNAIEEGFWEGTLVSVLMAILLVITAMKDVEQFEVGGVLGVIVFAMIAFGIRRRSRAAAIAGLTLYVSDRLYALISGAHGSLILPLFITLAFLNAVRGTIAYHRLPALPANLPSVEQSFKAMGTPSSKSEENKMSGAQ